MLTHLLLPWLPGFRLDDLPLPDQTIDLKRTAVNREALCPCCNQPWCALPSHYDRTISDLPWAHLPLRLRARVRTFLCRNPAGPRTLVTERVPPFLARSSRRTQPLATEQRQRALEQAGEAAARTAARQAMPRSPRTLLRLSRRTPSAALPPAPILGVDDGAFRKGQTSGTLLLDLELQAPIALRADRSAASLAGWLDQHGGVAISSRERAADASDGARGAAAPASQLADRCPLLPNRRAATQRRLERHQAARPSASAAPRTSAAAATADLPAASTPGAQTGTPVAATEPLTRAARGRQERRAARRARSSEGRALQRHGHGIGALAPRLGLRRHMLRRRRPADQFPEPASRPVRARKRDPAIA